jgi:hypothetical protein
VTAANRALTALSDTLMSPFERLPAIVPLLCASLLTAIGALLVFKWASNQRSLAAAKRGIHAAIFEMRLFSDDLRALLSAQGDVLRYTLRYLRFSLVPTAWLLVPVLLLMLHLEFYFGYTGLTVGQRALVKVTFDSAAAAQRAGEARVSLDAPDSIEIETPAVVIPSQKEVVWRIRPRAEGAYEVRIHVGRSVLSKILVVSDAIVRRSPVRPNAGMAQLLNPSEQPVPSGSGVAAITIIYPERAFDVAGWKIDWAYVYLALTLIFAVALRSVFGVII